MHWLITKGLIGPLLLCVAAAVSIPHLTWAASCRVHSDTPYETWRYEGDCVDGLAHGEGTATHAKLGTYVGDFERGYMHGQGTFNDAKGGSYVGGWRHSLFHGQGTMTFPSGGKYVGEFVDGLRSGNGTELFPNGDKYEGAYRAGKANGYGVRTQRDGSIVFAGEWRNGQPFDPGKPFGLKTETTKEHCNAVIHPLAKDMEPLDWVPLADRISQYFMVEFGKLQMRWASAMGKRAEMHQGLLDMERCGSQAVADLRVAQKLAIAACGQLKDPAQCLQLVGTSYSGHEDAIIEELFSQLAQSRRQTYDIVGRP